MKTIPRQLYLLSALACFGTLTLAALAQNTSAPVGAQENRAAAASPAASAATSTSTATQTAQPAPAGTSGSTVPTAPAEASSTGTTASSASTSTATGDTSMRRLDTATETPDVEAVSGPDAERTERVVERRTYRRGGAPRVGFFGNVHLGRDESADAVVAIAGNTVVDGEVSDAVVSVFGNSRVTGRVGDAVVAVFGNAYVDSEVKEVVAVLGNIELGPNAVVRGDVVTVGGMLKRDPKAVVEGEIPTIQFAFAGFEQPLWIQAYVSECIIKARPLAFAPGLGWAWVIAFGFLFFYMMLALLFRGGIEKTVTTLETRPGGSILAALLTLLLTPVLMVLLIITLVGIPVVPFLGIGLMLATLFGKATMLAWLGRRITRLFGPGPLSHPAFAVLIGGLLIMGLYVIPVVGFITYKLLGFLGLGVVVYTLIRASRRERPKAPQAPLHGNAPVRVVVPEGVPVTVAATAPGSAYESSAAAGASGFAGTATMPAAAAPLPPTMLVGLPRAGFWIRTAALFIDLLLVAAILALLSGMFPDSWEVDLVAGIAPVIAAYGAVLWKLKGTTIGGIICGLRVVRVDDRPLDWPTVVVRALACFISALPLGLGFIWAAIDEERQSWHDKIAGTTVVHARGNNSLV